jgi:rhomboid family protein
LFIPLHDANRLRYIHRQYVTFAIIAVNCLIWFIFGSTMVASVDGVRAAIYSFGFIPAVANGYVALPSAYAVLPEYATYITYAFFHADFMHLAGNMLFIWVFGDNVEDAMGHLRFAVFFLACAAAGALAHSLFQPESASPLIGASGAAAGIVAAYLLLHPLVKVWVLALGRIPLRLSALWVIGAWIVFQFASLFFANGEPVSWGAHIGGMIAGAALLPLLKRREAVLFDRGPADAAPPLPAHEAPVDGEHATPGKQARWGRQDGGEF